jgi:hypothetical protein
MDRLDLARELLRLQREGRLDAPTVLAALGRLAGEGPAPVPTSGLIEALEAEADPELRRLARPLRDARRLDAIQAHRLRRDERPLPPALSSALSDLPLDAPLGWTEHPADATDGALQLLRDRCFVAGRRGDLLGVADRVEERFRTAARTVRRASAAASRSARLQLLDELERRADLAPEALRSALGRLRGRILAESPEADEETALDGIRESFRKATAVPEQREALNRLLAWPTSAAAPVLFDVVRDDRALEHARAALHLRFGEPGRLTPDDWRRWLTAQARRHELRKQQDLALARSLPGEFLLLLHAAEPDPDPDLLASLSAWCEARAVKVDPADFADRWSWALSSEEWTALCGTPEPAAPPEPEEPPPPADALLESRRRREEARPDPAPPVREQALPAPAPAPRPAPRPRPAAPPPPPSKPSVWEVHLKPFFLDNWYMVAGVVMVVVGLSLLAYYTWDKSWALRYTLMPSLVGAFTAALAWVGGWIERRDAQHRGTGAVLRGTAIGLLPVNFMAVALLAVDGDVRAKALSVPLMGALYLGLFGWGLFHWCRAIHPSLGRLLGGTLLLLNGLVTVGPLAKLLGAQGQPLQAVVSGGFYLGFAAAAGAVLAFTRRVLTTDLAKEKLVPWFFGATLGITFLQVFAWVHGFMAYLPSASTYAALVILSGWLVLHLERRTNQLRGEEGRHSAESFVGFALILLGLLMGARDEVLRIVCLLLAGTVWIVQAAGRKNALHAAIGLTMVALGEASVALLEDFHTAWIPALGIGVALTMGLVALLASRRKEEEFARAARALQVASLLATTVAAVFLQWHTRSEPLAAGAALLAVAALFGWRGWRDRQVRWIQTAMVVVAVALPYLGCLDLARGTLRGNTLPFGLGVASFAWIALCAVRRSELLLAARSTVLLLYGAIGAAALAGRVFLERGLPGDALWYLAWMDYLGPVLLAAALGVATYCSRSLLPAFLAAALVAVLLPEMKGHLRAQFPQFQWGSGFGTAVTALLFTLSCFRLRTVGFLKNLDGGDRYLGTIPFPLRRTDHTLFTWPLAAAAVFLAAKVDTWNLARNLLGSGVSVKASIALGVTGAVWTLLAVLHRERRGIQAATHLGWICLAAAFGFGLPRAWPGCSWTLPVLATGLSLQALHLLYRFAFEPRHPWVREILTAPVLGVLQVGSGAASLLLAWELATAPAAGTPLLLAAFLIAQLLWHGFSTRHPVFGSLLFFLVWAGLLSGSGLALQDEDARLRTLGLLLAAQVVPLVAEFRPDLRPRLAGLLPPIQAIATALAALAGFLSLPGLVFGEGMPVAHHLILLPALFLGARAYRAGGLALLGLLLGWILAQERTLGAASVPDRLALLLEPVSLARFSLLLAAPAHAASALHARLPRLLASPFARPWPVKPWILGPAVLAAAGAALAHSAWPALRETPYQLQAPYLAALTLGIAGLSWGQGFMYGAGAALTLGNIHAVRLAAGPWLLAHGLSEMHLVCLGIGASLIQIAAARLLFRSPATVSLLHRAGLAGAGLILALLSANYVAHRDLREVTAWRFAVSGAIALLAALHFRLAARRPGPGEESSVPLAEGAYHFGVTMALWCAALMVPVFRTPVTALVALGLPVFYFHARAEFGRSRGLATFARYRTSAATLAFVVLGLYALRPFLQMAIFPEDPFEAATYHRNSPVILAVSLVLLRLHALGGTGWLAFYGGLALMAGSAFAVTGIPGLSPFEHPVPAAWAVVAVAHFWTAASAQRSPVRTAIERLGGIDGPAWLELRRAWGRCLLAGSLGAVAWGLAQFPDHPKAVAPLLLGAASLFVHHGVLKSSAAYLLVAALLGLAALHADFALPSHLPKEHVVWAVLAAWAAFLAVRHLGRGRAFPAGAGRVALAFGATTLAHVAWHHPSSPAGLWAFGLGAVLAALTPRAAREASGPVETSAAAALPWVPVWLVWFALAPLREEGLEGAGHAWPTLCATATLFLTGLGAGFFRRSLAEGFRAWTHEPPRLFDQTLSWLAASGAQVRLATLGIATGVCGWTQFVHLGERFQPDAFVLLLLLFAGLTAGWAGELRERKSTGAFVLAELCALGFLFALRSEVVRTVAAWTPEYDAAALVGAFLVLAGMKPLLDRQPREVRMPLLATLFLLPVASIGWVIAKGLGTDAALVVVGLQSAAFAYMGKDDRESPYHAVATAGFTAFALLVFWGKLRFREVHAYVLPVGTGLLVLVQLFARKIEAELRNGVRLVTLLAMMGSAAYYALLDPRHPLAFNLTLVLLCLAAMGLGGLFKIRLYLILGFTGLMVDLASIVVKVLARADRSVRMTAVGSMVLAVGTALVFGAIYYKTHRKEIEETLGRLRLRLASWE